MISFPTGIKRWRRPRELKLRARLLLGLLAGLLLISVLTLLFYSVAGQLARDLRQIENQHLTYTTSALKANEDMTAARRYEKDFLLSWRELGYAQARARYQSLVVLELNEIRKLLRQMHQLDQAGQVPPGMPDSAQIERQLDNYQLNFLEMVQLHGRLGQHDSGLEGEFRRRIEEFELSLPPGTALENQLLELRLAEKDYLLRGQPRYAMAVQQAAQQLTRQLTRQAQIEAGQTAALSRLLAEYQRLFQEYVQSATRIEQLRGQMSEAANLLEPLLQAWYRQAEAANDQQFLQTITSALRAAKWFSIAGMLAFALMLLSGWLVWRGLARSIARTVEFAAQIAAGNLSTHLTSAGNTFNTALNTAPGAAPEQDDDEIARLDHALNDMADALAHAQESLMQHMHQLEQANRAKDEFLATISHELRTPLNQILGFTDLLKEGLAGPLSAEQKHMLQDIFDAGHQQLAMINNMIELARLQAGKIELQAQLQDPAALLHAIGEPYRARAAAAGVSFELELAADLPPMPLDARLLQQLLRQLLDNAFQFTPAGGQVRLLARSVARAMLPQAIPGDATQYLELSVIDNGPGLAAEDQQNLFQPFVQAQSSLTRSHQGMGLGLPLAKLLTELHGGSISISCAPAAGCTLLLYLPVDGAETGA